MISVESPSEAEEERAHRLETAMAALREISDAAPSDTARREAGAALAGFGAELRTIRRRQAHEAHRS